MEQALLMYEHKEIIKGKIKVYSAPTYEGLVQAVVRARRDAGTVVPYGKVYNELRGKSQPKLVKVKTRGKSVYDFQKTDIITGAKAIFANMSGEIVSQGEILRRADICAKCPKKEMMSGCMSCGAGKAVLALYNASVGLFKGNRYEIPVDLKKANCGVCGCYISTMLPAKLEDFAKDTPQKAADRPSTCWLKEPLG